MKNLEMKKNKGLKLNFTILILFAIHLFSILIAFKTKDFQVNKYPLARILDSYLAISLFFNPIALSSLVKKVIEIEEKNNMWQMQISLGLKVQKILLDKIKNLSIKVFLLQIIEWLIIIFLLNCWSNVWNNYYANIKNFITNKSLWTPCYYLKYKLCKRWTSIHTDYE